MKFLDALLGAKQKKKNIVIPDIKCFSPKEGDLMRGRNPVLYAQSLQRAGAPVLSVVTEEKEFHGSLSMLREIADAVDVPILRKDFIHTREELIETKEAGASAILLMCSCLEKEELFYLYEQALEIGLDPFVETHVAEDFEIVHALGAKLVGINNRDILVLERDEGNVSNTISLAKLAPKDAFLITESSIQNPMQVRAAIQAGADAALVGTAILQAEYTEAFYKMMCRKVSLKICGLMNEEDIDLCVKCGVERIGLVVEYPISVPWNLTKERATELRKRIPSGYQACIVVGGSRDTIQDLCDVIKPDFVQLHYKETLEEIIELANDNTNVQMIKTIPMDKGDRRNQFGCESVSDILSQLNETNVSGILVDPRQGEAVTSKTLKLDVDLAKDIMMHSKKPVIIAGGLNVDNMEAIIKDTGCTEVDVMNGSEDTPGKKNEEKIRKMIEILENL